MRSLILGGILVVVTAFAWWFQANPSFGATILQSFQLATDPDSGECLETDGTNNVWDTCGGSGGGSSNATTTSDYIIYKEGGLTKAYSTNTFSVISSDAAADVVLRAVITHATSTLSQRGADIYVRPGDYYLYATTTFYGLNTNLSNTFKLWGAGQDSTRFIVVGNSDGFHLRNWVKVDFRNFGMALEDYGNGITALSGNGNADRSVWNSNFDGLFFQATSTDYAGHAFLMGNDFRSTYNNINFQAIPNCIKSYAESSAFNNGDNVYQNIMCSSFGNTLSGTIAYEFHGELGGGIQNQGVFNMVNAFANSGSKTAWSLHRVKRVRATGINAEGFATTTEIYDGSTENSIEFTYLIGSTTPSTYFYISSDSLSNSIGCAYVNSYSGNHVLFTDLNTSANKPNMLQGVRGHNCTLEGSGVYSYSTTSQSIVRDIHNNITGDDTSNLMKLTGDSLWFNYGAGFDALAKYVGAALRFYTNDINTFSIEDDGDVIVEADDLKVVTGDYQHGDLMDFYPNTDLGNTSIGFRIATSTADTIQLQGLGTTEITVLDDIRLWTQGTGNATSTFRITGETLGDFRGGYLQYDHFADLFNLGVHNATDSASSSDINIIQLERDGTDVRTNASTLFSFTKASTTRLSVFDKGFFGGTATTTIRGDNATSTFAGKVAIATTTTNTTDALQLGWNNRIMLETNQLWETASGYQSDLIRLVARDDEAKPAITWYDASSTVTTYPGGAPGLAIASIIAHDYLTFPTNRHQHISIETKNGTDNELHSRFECLWGYDDGDAGGYCGTTSNYDFKVIGGDMLVTVGDIRHGSDFSILPNWLLGNTTRGLNISTSSVDNLRLFAMGGTEIEIADDMRFWQNAATSTIRFAGEAANNFQGGFVKYDHFANSYNIGVHNTADSLTTSDIDVLKIDRDGTDIFTNASTLLNLSKASTTRLSVFGGFWAGGSATTTITSAGFLGVASSTPWRTLSVTGTMANTGMTGATGGTNNDVCITTAGDFINETTGVCVVSSGRFKKDIKPLEFSALDLVAQLNPVSFTPKEDDKADYDDRSYSLIAEEVAAVDPHLVRYGTDGLPRTLDDFALLSLHTKAIQELNDRLGETPKEERHLEWLAIAFLALIIIYQQRLIRRKVI